MSYLDNKPDCYGDEDYYDEDDEDCQACQVRKACSIRASRGSRTSTSRTYTRSYTRTPTPKTTAVTKKQNKVAKIIEDPSDDTTFAKILLHNTGLEVLQTMVDELGNSIRHIPRIDYGKYFDRKKK